MMKRLLLLLVCLMLCLALACFGCSYKREASPDPEPVTQTLSDPLSLPATVWYTPESETVTDEEPSVLPATTTTKPPVTPPPTTTQPPTMQPPTTQPPQPDDGWRQAYMDCLHRFMKEQNKTDENNGFFSLVYIDEDDIPELVVTVDTAHMFTPNVVSYNGRGGIVDHGEFGTFGAINYLEKKNIIVSDVIYQGIGSLTIHKLTPSGAQELWQGGHSQVWSTEADEVVEVFDSYGETITEEEFNALYHRYVPDESALKSSLDENNPYVFRLTAANIDKISQLEMQ